MDLETTGDLQSDPEPEPESSESYQQKTKMRVTKRVLWIFLAKVNPQPNQQNSLKAKLIIALYVENLKQNLHAISRGM